VYLPWVDWKCRTWKWGTNEGPLRSKSDRHHWKIKDLISRVKKCRTGKYGTGKCRTENAGLENGRPKIRGGKCRTRKCRTEYAGGKMQDWKMKDQFHFVHWIEKKTKKNCCALLCNIYAILSYAGVVFNVLLTSAKTHSSDTDSAKNIEHVAVSREHSQNQLACGIRDMRFSLP